ncbi:MAG: hypothetical protein Q7R65_01845, partial [bacterium]|nr:hypothetical protein [bacterium]
PVWLATSVSPTNPVNTVSFDAMFVGTNGSDSLLSVYWETNVIGTVDELYVQPGFQHYSLSFPQATAKSTYVFGLRLDPFTNAPSSIILTNVALGFVGIKDPLSLSFADTSNQEQPILEFTGPAGFNYTVEASTNLVDWTSIAILVNTNGTVKFFDRESASYNRRFYRVAAPY